jgi:hypothetical protein
MWQDFSKIAIAESLLEHARDESAQKVTDFFFPFVYRTGMI